MNLEQYEDFLENKSIKVKDFIFRTPCTIKGIKPIREGVNEYGVTIYFYLIKNSNLGLLLSSEYDNDFQERKYDDVCWFLNRWSVAIVNTTYLLEKFILKDSFDLMYRTDSNINVVL